MGHGSDKLYITHREHAGEFGDHHASSAGAKKKVVANFQRLPFDCCAISLKPFEMPMCTPDGTTCDLVNIIPYIKKFGRDPATGSPLASKDLIKLNFFKNTEGNYYDPVTYKVFNQHTHLVAIKTSGNVFSKESIDRLNIKPGHWFDLVTDQKFSRADLITLQDPHNVEQKDLSKFDHLKNNLKVPSEEIEALRKDPMSGMNLSAAGSTVSAVLKELGKDKDASKPAPTAVPNPTKGLVPESTMPSSSKGPVPYNASVFSKGKTAASFTSTSLTPATKTEVEIIDEEDFMFLHIKEKGYLKISTNLGDLNMELYCDRAPRTCYNFFMLARQGYYDNTEFHRLIPGFMIQGGDPTGTGKGGQSYWGKPFGDEFNLRNAYKHTGRGMLSMANHGKDTNGSQFFITFRETPHLNNKHTVFGRVVGGESVLNKLESCPIDQATDRPLRSLKITAVLIFDDPFEKYKERLSKRLQKEKNQFDVMQNKLKQKEIREKDRITWFGTVLDDPSKKSGDEGVSKSSTVGKYLKSNATPSSDPSGAGKRLSDSLLLGEEIGVKQPSKRRKGFGDLSGW
uniref:Cyclophilin RING n=1 Tax=Puccinia cf. psidii AE-2014 TaxID=1505670 RepID=A0A060IEE8_9BASI|nr:cyclophilin RING [Puccinia cf. psidii AE-2014]